MNTLDSIADALSQFDDEVHYGTAANHDRKKPWNYTVFSRSSTKAKSDLTGFAEGYIVSVVRENYVPETVINNLIATMIVIPGMKLDRSRDIEYVYDVKPGTNNTVEMLIAYFVKARKP